MPLKPLPLLLLLSLLLGPPPARAAADLQFFGDVMLTARSVAQTQTTVHDPQMFAATQPLLDSAKHNIVNLEGVLTDTLIPYEYKRFRLPMPLETADLLQAVGIDFVTLANNHTMDFGFLGLLSTMNRLTRAGLAFTGAGVNAGAAAEPLIIPLFERSVCLLAFSRTLPMAFWATTRRAGTALASEDEVAARVGECSRAGHYTAVTFHWGQEEENRPLSYQIHLAHAAIEAGADLVVGHHPHRFQPMEIYQGRPIFYSLGNYAFGSAPLQSEQEGLAVRVTLPTKADSRTQIDLVPLAVSNAVVRFQPRPASREEADDFAAFMPRRHPCKRLHDPERWSCFF